MGVMSFNAFAQKQVTIEAGTEVHLQSLNKVKAADVQIGQTVDFQVSQDVNVDDACAIPRGTIVKGMVLEAKKSSSGGAPGRLGIVISGLSLGEGESVKFENTYVAVNGKNRKLLSVVVDVLTLPFFCIPGLCIPGTKAVMPEGYEVTATVAENTTVKASNNSVIWME